MDNDNIKSSEDEDNITIEDPWYFTGVGGSREASKQKRQQECDIVGLEVEGKILESLSSGLNHSEENECQPRVRQSILRRHRRLEKQSKRRIE